MNNNSTPLSKKRPLEEKELEYVFAKPICVAPTPRKTKRQSPGNILSYFLWQSKLMSSVSKILNSYQRVRQSIPNSLRRARWTAP